MENTPNTVSKGKTVFVSAGDVSGDIHAAHLVEALKELDPSVHIIAIGGPRLKELADEFILDLASQGVLGFVEPLKKLPLFAKLIKQVRHIFQTQRPNAFVAVDFYGLNHQFLNAAKAENIPAYYYVTPQVWASRQYRAKQLAALTRKMYVIYPFEPEFHKARGGNAVFLGNPLLDNMPAAKPKNFEVSDPKTHAWKLGLLPGSRHGEITRLLPIFYQTFKEVCKEFPHTQAYIFLLPNADEQIFLKLMGEQQLPAHVHFVKETDYKLRSQMDFLLACSGTATLENALLGVPMLVAYQLFWPTYIIARLVAKVKYISLVNLLADKPLVQELIQMDANVQHCADITKNFFAHPERLASLHKKLLELRASLGQPGVAKRAAADILGDL
ncbi:MAG: lipid-A-disaccharide synthase [Elusimicrobiaceae bacterium]|nr:lipid-A-disaccharide synthase [Elusimicrobiaceae bacterium]